MLNADIFVSHSLIKDWHQKSQALADDSLARTVYDQLRLNLNLTVATLLTVIYIKNDCSELRSRLIRQYSCSVFKKIAFA